MTPIDRGTFGRRVVARPPSPCSDDLAVVPDVLRQVNRGHPPAPELALDDVAVAQSGLKSIGRGVGQMEALQEVL
jgi:hypothetical protein